MTEDRIAAARRWFAEELKHTARVRSRLVLDGFATVPREHFSGAGPWRLLSPMRREGELGYWTTEDADPAHLYHDVLVAIDERRGLNNGQPRLWAFLFDTLDLARGEHVVHVGTGTGYYTAILAEIVGAGGRVSGIEVDPVLASRSRGSLAANWPQVKVITTDGFASCPAPADVIVVNAGVSHLSLSWLDALAPENGRLLVPLTVGGRGAFLLIRRRAGDMQRYSARFVCWTGIFPCIGGRDPEAEAKLKEALQRSSFAAIRSLRRAPEAPDSSCWLAGDGWWLSTGMLEGEIAGMGPSSGRLPWN